MNYFSQNPDNIRSKDLFKVNDPTIKHYIQAWKKGHIKSWKKMLLVLVMLLYEENLELKQQLLKAAENNMSVIEKG